MGRVNVYLPDRLEQLVRCELPELSLSQFVQQALSAAVESCTHDELACACCCRSVARDALEHAAQLRLFVAIWSHVEAMDQVKLASPDMVARRLRKAAAEAGLDAAERFALPRASRSQYEARMAAQGHPDRVARELEYLRHRVRQLEAAA